MKDNIGVTPGKFSGNMYHPERMYTTARDLHKRSKNFVDECPELYKTHHMKNDGSAAKPKGKQSYMKETSDRFKDLKAKRRSLLERITSLLEARGELEEDEFLELASQLVDEGKTTGGDHGATGERVGKSVDQTEYKNIRRTHSIANKLRQRAQGGIVPVTKADSDAAQHSSNKFHEGLRKGRAAQNEGKTTGGDPKATGTRVGKFLSRQKNTHDVFKKGSREDRIGDRLKNRALKNTPSDITNPKIVAGRALSVKNRFIKKSSDALSQARNESKALYLGFLQED